MKHTILAFILFTITFSCSSDSTDDGGTTPVIVDDVTISKITYQTSDEIITNPERGFMHTYSVASEGTSLNSTILENLENENVSLILRLYYLDSFKETDLSEAQLTLIKTDFERIRDAGIKCVLRFAYNDSMDETDAPLSSIQTHLDQLKPIFEDNADIIAFVQAGFIGSWGEWAFTTNGLTTTANKTAVVNKLLEVLPETIKIQLRTPGYKQEIFNYSTAIGSDIGYGTSDLARVGFHNDCFLASVDDYGTYSNVAVEKDYISKEALYVPTGGETCPPSGIPTASCEIAEDEMELLKWTYLNLDYDINVLNEWRINDCFEDFEKQLGYRLALKTAQFKKEVALNSDLNINIVIDNMGFAPVYNEKNEFLVLRSITDGTLYKKALDFDVRFVNAAVNYTINENVSLSDIPTGQYELLLKIEDTDPTLSERTEYAIQLANLETWEEDQGLNNLLHTLTIN